MTAQVFFLMFFPKKTHTLLPLSSFNPIQYEIFSGPLADGGGEVT